MKKLDSKGFLLTELLVTATLVSTVLIFLYTQFYTIKRSYDTSFKYNTVNGLYALSNVRAFLEENDIYILTQGLNTTSYIDLKNDNLQTANTTYFNELMTGLNIKYLIFTNQNIDNLISQINNGTALNSDTNEYEDLKKFIKRIDFDNKDTSNNYRIIAEFNDNTFASILVGGE